MNKWETEEDKKEWTKYGLKCIILRQKEGKHLCGYVGLTKSHPFYGKAYNSQVPTFGRMDRKTNVDNVGIINALCSCYEEESGKAQLCLLLDAHGGITYTNKGDGKYLPKNRWWIGFDCAHAGDDSPGFEFGISDDIYRDMEYVTVEVDNLAKQLHDIKQGM